MLWDQDMTIMFRHFGVAHVLSVSVSAQAIQAENKRRQVRMDFREKAGGGFQVTWRI